MSTRPDVVTELAEGADPIAAFEAGCGRSRTGFQRVTRAVAADAVVQLLLRHGVERVALASDLDSMHLQIDTACRAVGLDVVEYADVAGERERVAALDATVTGCAAALAPTGTIVTTAAVGRAAALIAPLHVCLVRPEQVLDGLTSLFRLLPTLGAGSLTALQTGPSRTADIEKVLVIGAHGPAVVEVLVVD